jgi:hypothetical protein
MKGDDMEKQKLCGNCVNFNIAEGSQKDFGECRFNPPEIGGFLSVHKSTWCDQFEPVETAKEEEVLPKKEEVKTPPSKKTRWS